MKNEEYLREVQRSIGEGDLEEAFKTFLSYFDSHPERQAGHDAVLIQSGRYMQLRRDRESGTLDSRQFNLEMNSIRQNILSVVREEDTYLSSLSNPTSQGKRKDQTLVEGYQSAFARIHVLACLLDPKFVDRGLDIGSLTRISQLEKRKLIVAVLNELAEAELLERYKDNEGGLTHNRLTPSGIKQFDKFRNFLSNVRITNQEDVQ